MPGGRWNYSLMSVLALIVLLAGLLGLGPVASRGTTGGSLQAAEPVAAAELPPFEFQKNDHLCIIGNTLAERLQHDGWLETFLYARLPDHHLTIRNLGYSGDEITLRLRSADFGTPDQWLSAQAPIPKPNEILDKSVVNPNRFEKVGTKADVIFAFFGYNESWAGEAGLPKFKSDLAAWIKHTLAQKYNGKSAPRLVLFSPNAFEDHQSPHLPTGAEAERINRNLALYTQAMREVAAAQRVHFVDIFTPTKAAYAKAPQRLTINGIHLTEAGNRQLAEIIDAQLFPAAGKYSPPEEKQLARIRPAVQDKAFHWFQRYRVTDGYSIYGGRAWLRFPAKVGQSNYEVMQRELEVLDIMTLNRDQVIWAVAQGRDAKPDDSNLPPFVPVQTNKPGDGPNGSHLFLSGEAAIKKMTVGKGLKVNLFADEAMFPNLVNPVQMAWDTKGRLWVAVWPTYPHWKPTEPYNDKILILEDTNGDGQADKCITFADGLQNPTGFEFYNGGVIVAQAPDLMFLKDTTGDDRADVRERILHGLDTADTHHTANSFVFDPGGALYFQEGTFHHSQIEDPYGPPKRVANGAVFRYEPRTHKLEVYISSPFANPHGHVFDRWGQDIVIDGTGAQPYHAPLFSGYLPYPHKHPKPPQVYQQRTRPSGGMELLSSQHFPPEWQGNLLVTNCIGFQGLLRYKLTDAGSSFTGQEQEPVISSSDPNFRPVDAKIGPDGAIYILDWHNPIIGHMQHNLRDPSRDRSHGRIYRITYEGRPLSQAPPIAGESIEKLVKLLGHPEDRVRYRAKIELGARPSDDVLAAAKKWLESQPVPDVKNDPAYEHARLEVLWLHQYHNVVHAELLRAVLQSPDFRARAAAVRVLTSWRERVPGALGLMRAAINDPHPRVRLMAVCGLSFFPASDALPVLLEALSHPTDQYIDFVFKETLRAIEGQLGVSSQGGAATMLVQLLTSGKVPPERQPSYIETICRQGNAQNLKTVWDSVVKVETLPVPLRRLAAEGLVDAAITRKVKPTGPLDVASLLASAQADLREVGVKLAGAWQLADAAAQLRDFATRDNESLAIRVAAVEALGAFTDADSQATLAKLGGANVPTPVRFTAIATIAKRNPQQAAPLAAAALAQAQPDDKIGLVIDAFLTRKGGPEELTAALAKTPLGADAAKLALRYMYTAGRSDAGLSEVLTKAAGLNVTPKPPTAAEIQELVALVMKKGDPARGEAIFRRADLGCFKCHAISKAGGNVGPELSALGGSSPVEYVVSSILDPNAAIKELYTTRVITTINDQVFTGIVVSRDDQRVILRDATGKLITIPVKDIDTEREGKSLMPDGLTKFLTQQELIDLSRFLAELGKPGAYAVQNKPTIQRWRVFQPTDPALAKTLPENDTFRRLVLGAKPDAWLKAYGTVAGFLPFAELRHPEKPGLVYAQGEVELANDGVLYFDIQGPVRRIWIDDQAMGDNWNKQWRLTAGRHTITFALDTAAHPEGQLRVEINAGVGSTVRYQIINGE
ncbi:MAG: HEAT repeat domain-containing protein [Gemmataceae bacterium]|nr:HEAT repeat domain-containing protein [Gemmata sp.]MDW8197783.1 HEAT repeat domain-containing protein [Gemmataceae bacterium]